VPKRITIIQGHPDPSRVRFGYALADAYRKGAEEGGHEVRLIDVATLDFPVLHTKHEWEAGAPAPSIVAAQQDIAWAEHLVIFYPLWLGGMPALLKSFFEQVCRPGFAVAKADEGGMGKKLLAGKSARVVITMGMPAVIYRWYFRAHSLKSLERNILGFAGVGPVRESLFGMIEHVKHGKHEARLAQMYVLGIKGN
jgi:putative NADPH-quinone reductase